MKIWVDNNCDEYIGKKVVVIYNDEIKEITFSGFEDISYSGPDCYVGYAKEIPYFSFHYFYTSRESLEEEQNEIFKKDLEKLLKDKEILENKIQELIQNIK